ncbi:MAG: MCE family protein [Deltaproteobacteria bacterium]|nr:MAG: MCE family protein [Deltaproteobacteria bacterium]
MSERAIEIKVGILVTVCVALLVVFIVLLGNFATGSGGEIFLDVDTSAALKAGAPIKVAGVPSGRVTNVDYRGGAVDPAVGRPVQVRVTLSIAKDKLATLRRDARFYITTQGVLGEKYVEIEPRGVEAPLLAPGDVVVGEPPLRIELMATNANRVLSSLSEILRKNERNLDTIISDAAATMKSVRRVAERADTLLADNSPKVGEVIDGLLAVEAEVKQLAEAANAVLGDGSEARAAVRNIAALSGDAREAIGPVVTDVRRTLAKYGDLADAGREFVGEVREVAARSLGNVDAVLDDVKVVTGALRNGEGTIGALLSDKEMYDDIREMMKDLKRHPWKFIWKE